MAKKRSSKDPYWDFLPEKKCPKPGKTPKNMGQHTKAMLAESYGLRMFRAFTDEAGDGYFSSSAIETMRACTPNEFLLKWASDSTCYLTVKCIEDDMHIPMLDLDSETAMTKAVIKMDKEGIGYVLFQSSSANRYWAFVDKATKRFHAAIECVEDLATDREHLALCRKRGAFYVRGFPRDKFPPVPIKDTIQEKRLPSPARAFAKRLALHYSDMRIELLSEAMGIELSEEAEASLKRSLANLDEMRKRQPLEKMLAAVALNTPEEVWDDI